MNRKQEQRRVVVIMLAILIGTLLTTIIAFASIDELGKDRSGMIGPRLMVYGEELEGDGDTVKLTKKDESIYTKLEQEIPGGYTPDTYINSFSMEVLIPDCIEIESVSVWTGDEVCEDLFGVSYIGSSSGLHGVGVYANKEALQNEGFYNKTYSLCVTAKLKDGITDDELAIYADSDAIVKMGSSGRVTIDENIEWSNRGTIELGSVYPTLTVSDSDEIDVPSNSISSRMEQFTYNFPVTIPSYATSLNVLGVTDKVDDCLLIQDVTVLEDGVDISNKWTITIEGNHVSAYADDPEGCAGKTYRLEITVQPKVVTEETLRKHGHYKANSINYNNSGWWNVGMGSQYYTGTVDTTMSLPPTDIKISTEADRYEHQVGDPIYYTVKFSHNTASCDASDVVVRDTDLLNFDLDIADATVSGITDYTLKPVTGGWEFAADKLSPGQEVIIKFTAKAKKILNGTITKNTATVKGYLIPEKSGSEEIYINSPKLDLKKSAAKGEDTISYTLDLTQINQGTFMRDIIIKDKLNTNGVSVEQDSIQVLDSSDRDITNKCNITMGEDALEIKTGLNLSDQSSTILPKEKSVATYKELNYESGLKVKYNAKIKEDKLVGTEINSTAEAPTRPNINGDLIKEDENIPSGGSKENHQVRITVPVLDVVQTLDKETCTIGDTATYSVEIKQAIEGAIAKNIMIKGNLDQEGMTVKQDSFKVIKEGKVITPGCEIAVLEKGNSYEIKTHTGLAKDEIMIVTYDVFFGDKCLKDKQVVNQVTAQGDNASESTDRNTILIKEKPILTVEKKSNKAIYQLGDTAHYELTVQQTVSGEPAKNVVIKDQFKDVGMVINKDTIQVMHKDTDITSQCQIAVNEKKNGFQIKTGKNLKEAEELAVRYQVTFSDESLLSKELVSVATITADNAESVETQITTAVGQPVLTIKKKSDQESYQLGDIGKYQLQIKQTANETEAKQIVIKDQMNNKGAIIDQKSLTVKKDNKDITVSCDIVATDEGFKVKTNADLKTNEQIVVTYKVAFSAVSLSGKKVLNKASAAANYAKAVSAEKEVLIGQPNLSLIKDSDQDYATPSGKLNYTLKATQTVPGMYASNVLIKDEFKEKGMVINKDSFVVTYDNKNITSSCKIAVNSDQSGFEIKTGENIKSGETLMVNYRVEFPEKFLDAVSVTNVATVISDNADQAKAQKVVTIKKQPALTVEKKSDKDIYHLGETAQYQLKLKQIAAGAVAENIVLQDQFASKGMKLDVDSIRVKKEQQDITSACKITATEDGFYICTKESLRAQESIVVTYHAKFVDKALVDKELVNQITVSADHAKAVEGEKKVTVRQAKLQMTKESSEDIVPMGGEITYTLKATQTAPDIIASNVVVKDQFSSKGVSINDIKVMHKGEDITKSCNITLNSNNNGFTIETGKSLGNEQIEVTYKAQFKDSNLAGHGIINHAEVSGENAIHAEVDHTVAVGDIAMLSVKKTSDKSKYAEGENVQYTLKVGCTTETAAKNVVVEDKILTKGLAIDRSSIAILKSDGVDITPKCEIKANTDDFVIKTNTNLKRHDYLTVTYQVPVKSNQAKSEKVKNIASASADNTPNAKNPFMVQLIQKEQAECTVGVSTPQTGDNLMARVSFATMLLSAGLVVVCYRRRMKEK